MLVVLPIASSDQQAALGLLDWARTLDSRVDFDCLLVIGPNTDITDHEKLVIAAEKYFRTVTSIQTDAPKERPNGKNRAFQDAARAICAAKQNGSFLVDTWLWLECDATPLKANWLSTIHDAHLKGGKPFSGFKHPALPLMDCVGVYPASFMDYSPEKGMLCRAAPFDRVCGPDIIKHVHPINHLIQYVHDINGLPPSFPDRESLKLIQDSAVLFHRCKDGSLIERLAESRGVRGLARAVCDAFARKSCPPVAAPAVIRPRQPEAFFQLGRFGDLILLLPAFKEWADRSGQPVVVVVSEQYASVLEGVSYVRPVIVPHDSQTQAGEAWAFAKSLYPNIRRTQLYGAGLHALPRRGTQSYSLDMWEATGLPLEMYYRSLPVFDRRDEAREKALSKRFADKVILVNMEGVTSPFSIEESSRVMAPIDRLADRNGSAVIHTSSIGAERIYDLLGLMDRAVGLITIDTSTSHLAAASKVPTIHLVRDDGKAGSVPKGNVAAVIGYSQVPNRLAEIAGIVEWWLNA